MQIEAGLDGTLFTEWQYNAEPIKFDAKLCYGVHIDVGFKNSFAICTLCWTEKTSI